MTRQKLLSIIREITEQPTAPFREEAVAAKICELLTECPHVRVQLDAFGNVIATYARGKKGKSSYAFAAHMDHPGYVRKKGDLGKKIAFLGGVPKDYLRHDPPTQDFGGFAMWDLPAFEERDDRIYSRACDDLIGCSVIVATMHELEAKEVDCTVTGIFSRAEEVGFVGAIKVAKAGLIPKSTTIVSLETSSERPPAVMGEGPIIRVGDRSSTFDSATTALLCQIATEEKIPFQRCLMSAGSCEATAYQLYGYRAAGITIALGNYHNCGPQETIAAEYVSITDVQNEVRLCTAIAQDERTSETATRALRKHLEENARNYRGY